MRSSGILFALWPQSINFYFKLKNQKRAASKRPIVWKSHSKGIYVQVLYCTIFSLLKHSMDSHFMAYNCVWWRLRSTYPISKKPFAFVESVFKNLSSERSNPTLPSLGINVVSSMVQICITSCQIWKWLSAAENTC